MKNLKKNIEELLYLFQDIQTKNSQESRRLQKVNKALSLLLNLNLSKVQVFSDPVQSYCNFRSVIHPEIWENWVVRKFFSTYHTCKHRKHLTASVYKVLLDFIKNLMDIPENMNEYPIHKSVISRNLFKIRQICIGDDCSFYHHFIDQVDPLGNTALMLAVKLRLYDEVQVLIDHGADPKYRVTSSLSSPLEVAIGLNDKVLVSLLVTGYHRDLYRHWSDNINQFSEAISQLDDFSVRMSWECISSFIPFIKKFTPSDEYLICKQDNKVKIDLTLVGWENLKVKRGRISIVFNGDYNRVLLIDHENQTSRELFGDLNYDQIEKHTNDLLKHKKYSTDLVFSECSISQCKTWRGVEERKEIQGYSCKKHEISCGVSLSLQKRPVLVEKKIMEVKTFSDYSLIASQKNLSFLVSARIEKKTQKNFKVSSWCSSYFPLKISSFMQLIELLSSVSHKVKRFQELLSIEPSIQDLGFPLKTKIPVVMTVTALVKFKDLKMGWKGDLDFEECLKMTKDSFDIPQVLMPPCSDLEDPEEDTVIGPKILINPAPQMDFEKADETFVKDFGIIEDDLRLKIKTLSSHRTIITKIKAYIETPRTGSNDVDIVI